MMKQIQKRLTDARTAILLKYPFFGLLLMRVKFGMAACGTAYTNMKHIVVDPDFVTRLDDEELQFLLLHEIMHIILSHCTRGRGLNSQIYNIACDIVVNSNLMKMMELETMEIDGEEVMHVAPDGKEGHHYDAEAVYRMLMDEYENHASQNTQGIDSHDEWGDIPESSFQEEIWKEEIKKLAKTMGSDSEIPPSVRQRVKELEYQPKLDWKELLRDFVQLHCQKEEYTFRRPNYKFKDYGVILPALRDVEELSTDNLWFCVDTSASVDGEILQIAFDEIKSAIQQCDNLSGKLSFFDTRVTEPQDFDSIESLEKCEARGGGGTSFHAIFHYMNQHMADKLPKAIIIITDGYAAFPDEHVSWGVPVLWVMVRSERKAPWGKNVVVDYTLEKK